VVNANLVTSKLAAIAEQLTQVRKHRRASAGDLAADQDARELVAFNLMLVVQGCADIAAHLIADEAWAPAVNLSTSFRRLQEHGVITEATREALAKAVGLRNVVAHGYAGMNFTLLHEAASNGVDDISRFTREISIWLTTHSNATG
jgi:uncharacterized protein YutE (UPF0331/DUF86 family)